MVRSHTICNATRCEASRALFSSLFYWEVSAYAIFEQVEADTDGVTPYTRIIKLLLQANELPVHVVLRLRAVAEYCAFLHWLTSIRNLVRHGANSENAANYSAALSVALTKTTEFVIAWRKREQQCFIYRSLHDSGILQSLCLIVTSTKVHTCVRQAAIRLLRVLVDFNGGDITGAVFLAHTRTEIASLVLKILARSANTAGQPFDESELLAEKSLLPYALHALRLVDNLALANQRDELDCEERVSALHGMLMLSVTAEGVKALIAALAYASCMEYVLEVFTLGSPTIGDEPVNDEVKARLRQSASYGYACEILFTLARLQSDGSFWRIYGVVVCRLIDSSFISAATSLKQWTDPLRYALAHAASASSLHFLLQRLASYSKKFANDEPPFAAITVLRLLNALLDEHSDASSGGRSESYYEIMSTFYDEGGLQQVIHLLSLANAKRSPPGSKDDRATLSGDSSIYVALVYPAICLIHKVHESVYCVQLLDVSAVDVLVDTYVVCGFGTTRDHIRMRRLILTTLAVYATQHSPPSKSALFMMLDRLFAYGLSQPKTFLAVVDVIRRLMPRPLPDSLRDRVGDADMSTLLYSRNCWMDHLLLFKRHLSFIVLLGISTLRIMRSHVVAVCVRFARLGAKAAKFIAEFDLAFFKFPLSPATVCRVNLNPELMEQTLRALAVSSENAVLNALDEERDEEGGANVSEEVRFGAATDYTTAAMVGLIATCLRDTAICAAFANLLASRNLFLTTTLKFFNVASHKTASHVVFQKNLIKVFVELCRVSSDGHEGVPILRFDLHLMICTALCEHITQNEQSLDTIIPALNGLIIIGETSKYTRLIVQKALVWRPGSLTRFVGRLEATSDCSSSVLNVASGLLLTLLEHFFSKWPLPIEGPNGDGCGEHPLLRLTTLLRESTDFEWSSSAVSRLENIIKSLERSFESNAQGNDCLEEGPWPSTDDGSRHIEEAITTLTDFSRGVLSDEITATPCDTDFDPPMIATDVKHIASEFFPEGALDSNEQRLQETYNNAPQFAIFSERCDIEKAA
ncbi:unnamed protein product [Toxocara canis]|uniref:Uncharacterized protein n=1 Tax=Toxocara canis TaxID=6265 RepID=A0A3P7F7Y5_TOXCA|nr:unnamed protein product [Toxocara canis]